TVNAQLTTNRDGALDKSFGQNGFAVATDRVGLPGEALLLPDGTVFQAHTGDSFASGYLITKQQPDGQLNVSFGQNGVKVIAFPHYNVVTSLAIQPDGKLLVGGYNQPDSQVDFCLIRLTTSGDLDATFGNGGIIFSDFTPS